ncbi:MAG: hypothetical protein NFCOHLIN_03231 [Gammaproteobacteria bacterium]|nr:hypothetical protein [Gammaproteobacteria bacterium]
MNRCIYPLALLAAGAPAIAGAADLVATPVWETEPVFKNPESALFDVERNVIYVSNVDGDAMGKDGHGFISRMTPDGHVTDLEWVTGLNGPKGMALVGGRLYVADIDTLVEIDIDAGTVSHRYPVPDAQFFNDATADNAGTVYVSDTMTNRIHRLYNGVFENWIEGSQLEGPNGLYATDNKLLLGTWGVMKGGFATEVPGHIKVIDIATKAVTDFGSDKPIGNMDGIALMADGSVIATDWMAGSLMTVAQDGTVRQLLDLNQGSADLEYIMNGSIAIVPMMADGKVIAYHIAEPAPEPAPEEMPAEDAAPATGQ